MLNAIEHALMMALTMAWEILWALILGFGLSAVIQAVVSEPTCQWIELRMREEFDGEITALQDHPAAIPPGFNEA